MDCVFCEKIFQNESRLFHHILLHTGERDDEDEGCTNELDPLLTANGENWKGKLKHSESRAKGLTGKAKRCSGQDETCTKTKAVKEQRRFQCEICKKALTTAYGLRLHLGTHSGERNYPCDICKKKFTEAGNLKRHQRIHTGEKPYKCQECAKSFSQSNHLEVHLRIHANVKPYQCEICQQQFTQNSSMRTHLLIHTGEMAYKCEICKKGFKLKGNLTTHMRIHTQDKPYRCSVCHKKFPIQAVCGCMSALMIPKYLCEHDRQKHLMVTPHHRTYHVKFIAHCIFIHKLQAAHRSHKLEICLVRKTDSIILHIFPPGCVVFGSR